MKLPTRLVPLAILASLALSGCGLSPTAPDPAAGDSPGASTSAMRRLSPGEIVEPAMPLEDSLTIKGQDGGRLSVGNFTLEVPPGAYHGNATITLRLPDPRLPVVEIEVLPQSKNSFTQGATLTADLSGWTRAEFRRASMWSVDPATGNFVRVAGATVDPTRRTVQASFMRLATSRVSSN